MNATTVNERVSALRKRRQEAGLVRLEFWVSPVDVEKVKKEVAGINAYRTRITKLMAKQSKEKT